MSVNHLYGIIIKSVIPVEELIIIFQKKQHFQKNHNSSHSLLSVNDNSLVRINACAWDSILL